MKYRTISIEREYGSGGREIAKQVANKLGIKCYGTEILKMAAEKSGFPEHQLEKIEEKANDTVWDSFYIFNQMLHGDSNVLTNKNELAKLEGEIIMELASKEKCLFVGRGSAFILGDKSDDLSVFIHADYEDRKERAISEYGIDDNEADKMMKLIDKRRANYYNAYRKLLWGEKEGYHMVLNSGKLGVSTCIDLIVNAFENRI